jgi:pyruvate,water dikinase
VAHAQTSAFSGDFLAGLNVAVLGENYLNLTLRVGYHFTVVDASMGPVREKNNIFFRFIGGATDMTRRSRRAILLSAIMEEFGFKVEKTGDLVIARAVNGSQEKTGARLRIIGRLIGFMRQLDILMRDDQSVDIYFNRFMTDHKNAFESGNK